MKVSSLYPGCLQVKGVFSTQLLQNLKQFYCAKYSYPKIAVRILTTFYLSNVVIFFFLSNRLSVQEVCVFSFNHQPGTRGCGLSYTSLLVCWWQRTNVRLEYPCFKNILQVAFVALGGKEKKKGNCDLDKHVFY